jgi:uncharacterized protein (DUF362 family)
LLRSSVGSQSDSVSPDANKVELMSKAVVLIRRGTDGLSMAYQALEELRAQDILSEQQRILIKPNITVNKPAASGVTTHVSVVEGVLRFLSDHRLGEEVTIGEGGGCDITRAYRELGFEDLARRYEAQLADFNREEGVEVSITDPLVQERFTLARTVTQSDCLINLPCLKIHTGESQATLCLKNLMGCLSRPRTFMHRDFNRRVIDLSRAVGHSELNLIDGLVGHERGEIHGDPVGMELLIASRDPVAADTVGAAVMGFDEGEVHHIALAGEMHLGQSLWGDIDLRGPAIDQVRHPFKRSRW